MCVLLTVMIVGSAGTQAAINITSGKAVEVCQHSSAANGPGAKGGNVLWDTYHGIYNNYSPAGDMSTMASMLSSNGYTVTTSNAGVLNHTLPNYAVVVISVGSAWYSAYSSAEVTALQTYVNGGGSLFILGENTGCPNANINPIGAVFGINFSYGDGGDPVTFSTHPMFVGVTSLLTSAPGGLSVSSPGTAQAWDAANRPMIATAVSGSGRVAAFADMNMFDNSTIGGGNNSTCVLNAFNWLSASGAVFWDTYHGIYLNYSPSNYYATLTSVLTSAGYTITESAAGIMNVNLSNYNIVVCCLGSNWNSAYSAAEGSRVQSFVNNGGGLLLLGDNPGCPNSNLTAVSSLFGELFGGAEGSSPWTNFTAHPIFTGVTSLECPAPGRFSSVSSPSSIVGRDPSSQPVIAVGTSGAGRVAGVTDINFCENIYIGQASNQTFSINLFNWLAGGSSAPTATPTPAPTRTPTITPTITQTPTPAPIPAESPVGLLLIIAAFAVLMIRRSRG